MNIVDDRWPIEKLTSTWTKFSQNLTGKKSRIQLHRDYDEWKECFAKIMGFPSRFSGGAFLSRKRNEFTIHLYLPESMTLEDRFEGFLHELAHIYLDHLGEREGGIVDCDAEADGWVFVNFSEEIRILRRLIHWRRYGEDSVSEIERPDVTQEQIDQIRSDIGDGFILKKKDKSVLSEWLRGNEEELREFTSG